MRSFVRRALRLVTAASTALALSAGCSAPYDAEASATSSEALGSAGLVISAVCGGGGNTGATYTTDFVELFNRGAQPVTLAGLSLQYASSAGIFSQTLSLPAATVQPGQYYLVALASGPSGAPLPVTADFTGTLNLSGTAGKVALANITTALGCGGATRCPTTNVIDMVGYGAATDYEGPSNDAVPALSATSEAVRRGGGCTDTDVNLADFDVVTPVGTPRTSASAESPCSVMADAGSDAGPLDSGPIDAGPVDSGTDTGPMDAGPADSGTDTGSVDAAPAGDSGSPGNTEGLVISQIYRGGGASGARVDRDFIEIFNRSGTALSLLGLSLQIADATGDLGANPGDVFPLPQLLVTPGQYMLVGLSTNNPGAAAPLPTVDVDSTLALAANSGKVALARITSPLGCGGVTRCSSPEIVDLVGFGTASDHEGASAAPALATATAILRNSDGCVETDDNGADFASADPNPRNHKSAANLCVPIDPGGSDAGADAGVSAPSNDAGALRADDAGAGDDARENEFGTASKSGGCGVARAGADGSGGALLALVLAGTVVSRARRRRCSRASR